MYNYTPFDFVITVDGLSGTSGNNNLGNILEGLSISKGLVIELPNELRSIKKIGAYLNIINDYESTNGGTGSDASTRPWYNVFLDLKGDGTNLLTFNNLIPFVPAVLSVNNVDNPTPTTFIVNRTSLVLTDLNPVLDLHCTKVRKLFIPKIAVSHGKRSSTTTIVYNLTGFIIWE